MSVTIDVEIELECHDCGHKLIAHGYGSKIEVEPCEICIDKSHQKGYEEGHSEGYDEAKEDQANV